MGRMVDFSRPDGKNGRGYLATPPGPAPRPGTPRAGILLMQEWWGLKPHILDVANQFAAAGYEVLAADLYRGRMSGQADEASHLMSALDFTDALEQDLAGALRWLAERCTCVGVAGFRTGGALALAGAARLPGLAAATCFYGIPPIELADPARIKIPLQCHFADLDAWCTPANVDALQVSLKVPAEIYRYQARQGFFNNTQPEVFDAACAAQAWERTLAFFRRHLQG